MRKALALFMVGLMMALTTGFASTAFAADAETATLTKHYVMTNAGGTSPAESLQFTVARVSAENVGVDAQGAAKYTSANMPLPSIANVALAQGKAAVDPGSDATVTVTLPTYEAVGVYTYRINEVDGGMAGVDYHTEDMRLVVTVTQNANGNLERTAAVHTEASGTKSDEFTNSYRAGKVSVGLTTEGNLADRNKAFEVKVTFTAPSGDAVGAPISYQLPGSTASSSIEFGSATEKTVTFTLKHGQSVDFSNVPYGVTYTVEETSFPSDYTKSGEVTSAASVSAASATVSLVNTKDATIDTGISLETLPFVAILVLAVAGLVLFSVRRVIRSSRS